MHECAYEPNAEQLAEWEEWKNSRPPEVKALCENFLPWVKYYHRNTRKHLCLLGFDAEGPEVLLIMGTLDEERDVVTVHPREVEPVKRMLH